MWRRRAAPLAVIVSAALAACNQDSASSNAERDTHMGDIRAAVPPVSEPPEGGIAAGQSASPDSSPPEKKAP
jgi:hypothetical protein